MTAIKEDEPALISRLERIQQAGVSLYLDGKSTTPEEIAANCVNEEAAYMPDYVTDEANNLKEIRYDKVLHR